MKYDGTLNFKGEVTPLQKVLLARRSFRKYRAGAVEPEKLELIRSASREFCEKMGFTAPRLKYVVEPALYKDVVKSSFSGFLGRTNPWLPIAKSPVMIIAAGDMGAAPTIGDRRIAMAQTAMAMEVAVLAAADLGLATCWIAAINHRAIEKTLGLPQGQEVIAISPLGFPPEGISLLSWDGVTYHMISKRRKPMGEILFQEKMKQ